MLVVAVTPRPEIRRFHGQPTGLDTFLRRWRETHVALTPRLVSKASRLLSRGGEGGRAGCAVRSGQVTAPGQPASCVTPTACVDFARVTVASLPVLPRCPTVNRAKSAGDADVTGFPPTGSQRPGPTGNRGTAGALQPHRYPPEQCAGQLSFAVRCQVCEDGDVDDGLAGGAVDHAAGVATD